MSLKDQPSVSGEEVLRSSPDQNHQSNKQDLSVMSGEDFLFSLQRRQFFQKIADLLLLALGGAWGSAVACVVLPYKMYAPFLGVLLGVFLVGWSLGYWGRKVSRLFLGPGNSALKKTPWSVEALGKHMECLYPDTATAFWQLGEEGLSLDQRAEMASLWQQEHVRLRRVYRKANLKRLWVLVLGGLLLTVMVSVFSAEIYRSSRHALSWLPGWRYPNTLTIKAGLVDVSLPSHFEIHPSSSPIEIQVLPGNRLHLKVRSAPHLGELAVVLTQRKLEGLGASFEEEKMVQSFRTQKRWLREGSSFAQVLHELSFRVEGDVSLWIPSLSRTEPLARVSIAQQSLPQVGLVLQNPGGLKDPWSDEELLSFKVAVASEEPLKELRWVIQTSHREYRAAIVKVLAKDQKRVVRSSSLNLAPYMRGEKEHMHIVAEAVAQGPEGRLLVGRSDPVEVTVISAYGRYQRTLEMLTEVRQKLWQWNEGEGLEKEDQEQVISKMQESYGESLETPFFDQRDRGFLLKLSESSKQAEFMKSAGLRQDLLSELHSFLEEHESLNDRQRDRDFFVASRALAQMLRSGSKLEEHQSSVQRMADFLEERRQRWASRITKVAAIHLPQNSSEIIENKHFEKRWEGLEEHLKTEKSVKASEKEVSRGNALSDLSEITTEYRKWMESLEKAEDRHLSEMNKKHMRSLYQAQQQLRGIQKNQDQIASLLDQPSEQNQDALKGQWPQTQQKQNHNLSQSSQLLEELKKIPYLSSSRVEAATQAMGYVLQTGKQGDFLHAEEFADLASRLLRESQQQMSQQRQKRSQQKRGSSSRKRVSGDNYFGQGVVYVPLKQSHEVAKKYRGDVLSDLGVLPEDQRDRAVMQRYLREMVR